MSKSNTLETSFLKGLFTQPTLTTLGDITLSGSVYMALYRSDPTDTDIGTEADYTGYTRVAVTRSTSNFTVTTGQVVNTNAVIFPQSTGGTNTITHFGIRTAATGGSLLYSGTVLSPLNIIADIIPAFNAGTMVITED